MRVTIHIGGRPLLLGTACMADGRPVIRTDAGRIVPIDTKIASFLGSEDIMSLACHRQIDMTIYCLGFRPTRIYLDRAMEPLIEIMSGDVLDADRAMLSDLLPPAAWREHATRMV